MTVPQAHLSVHALALGVIVKGSRLVRLLVAAHARHDEVQLDRLLVLHHTHLIVVVAAARVHATAMEDCAMRGVGFVRVHRHCDYLGLGPSALRFTVY